MIFEQMEEILPYVEKPGRYTGGELNSVIKKEGIDTRIALIFPDIYEVGVSNLGLQILYNVVNSIENLAAERAYAPWSDMEAKMREKGMPLVSLETGRPLSDFEILGFTIQHELCYSNILNMLDLGNVPLLVSERGQKDPLVIAGGPSAANPEPMSDFIDAFFVGDGEEGILDICRAHYQWKKSGEPREKLLEALASIEGIYVPSLFDFSFSDESNISGIIPLKKGYVHTKRRILTNLDSAPYPERFIVPNIKPVHDRVPLEVARGCSRFCRFCQAGYTYLPVRERSAESICELGDKAIAATGFDEVALLSLSTGDYSCLDDLLSELTERYDSNNTHLSFPSLRVDTLTPSSLSEMKRGRTNSFTIAPEAGSQRLRDFINKTLTEEQIVKTAEAISKAGCQSVKLYFMIGLPTETNEDLNEILELAKKILDAGRKEGRLRSVTVNLSTFVPKAHTPFQWERQISLAETREKLDYLKKTVKNRAISLKWQEPVMSILEGVFSRGDRLLGKAILKAFKKGARFDGWTERVNLQLWLDVFEEEGLSVERYLSERSKESFLPWEKVDIGVTKQFFLKELEKAFNGGMTMDCRYKNCSACGVCDHKVVKVENFVGRKIEKENKKVVQSGTERCRYRIRYEKRECKKYIGHIDMMNEITRMLRRAKMPLSYTEGFSPSPRISFGSPIPLGTESLAEYFDIELSKNISAEDLISALSKASPPGIVIADVIQIAQNAPSITRMEKEEHYLVRLENQLITAEKILSSVSDFNVSREWQIDKRTKKGIKKIDLKKEISSLYTDEDNGLHISISTMNGRRVKAEDAAAAILGLDEKAKKGLKILKVNAVLGTITGN